MANVIWTGGAATIPGVRTITVTAAGTGGTLTATINFKTVIYTCVAGDTTSTAAANWQALLAACQYPEFQELTFGASSANTFTVTGPATGAPFVMGSVGAGGATCTGSTTVTPSSPNDISVAGNYLANALPTGADTLYFDRGSTPAMWNLGYFSAIGFPVIRLPGYTGTIGLPDYNPAGYYEYRPTALTVFGANITIYLTGQETSQAFRVNLTNSTPYTISILGSGSYGGIGSEAVEIRGSSNSSSVLDVQGGSVAIAPEASETSVFGTIVGTGSVVNMGAGCTATSVSLNSCTAQLAGSWSVVNQYGGGATTVIGGGGGTNTNIYAGQMTWQSTGSPGTIAIGSGGVCDMSQSPAGVVIGAVSLAAGGSFNDPATRASLGYAITLTGCSAGQVQFEPGPGRTLTVT